jgi:hypothetical protein
MVAFPFAIPLTFHVTAVFVAPVTVAVNCCVAPRSTVGAAGDTLTVTDGGGGGGGVLLETPPPTAQPVIMRTNHRSSGAKTYKTDFEYERTWELSLSERRNELRSANAMQGE